jgi:hypothetical protein
MAAAPAKSEPEPVKAYDPWDRLEKGHVPGDIANAERGYQYTYAATKDYLANPAGLADWRQRHERRGFEPRNGPLCKAPGGEYHVSEPSAEIWRQPEALAADEWRVKLAECCFNKHWASHTLVRHPGSVPQVSIPLRDAVLEWHALQGTGRPDHTKMDPEKAKALKGRILNLVRKEPVHPGARPTGD